MTRKPRPSDARSEFTYEATAQRSSGESVAAHDGAACVRREPRIAATIQLRKMSRERIANKNTPVSGVVASGNPRRGPRTITDSAASTDTRHC
jgi:hypothetical protein